MLGSASTPGARFVYPHDDYSPAWSLVKASQQEVQASFPSQPPITTIILLMLDINFLISISRFCELERVAFLYVTK